MQKQTFENPTSTPNRLRRVIRAGKVLGAVAVATMAGAVYAHNNVRDYGYHPERNPEPPTYAQNHDGIDPSNIHPAEN